MTEIKIVREDEKATAILKAIRQIDDGEELEPVRHGRWLPQILLGERTWDCSECKTIGSPHWKRCPVCEAKMDAKTSEEAFREMGQQAAETLKKLKEEGHDTQG